MINNWSHIEEFSESFPNLRTELTQLSPGLFNSSAQTLLFDKFCIDKRTTDSAHIHHSEVEENTLNLVFPNNETSHLIDINNQRLNNRNQILAFSGEEILSTLPKNFNITTITLNLDILQNYVCFDIENFSPESFRKKTITNSNKLNLHRTIESMFFNLQNLGSPLEMESELIPILYNEAGNLLSKEYDIEIKEKSKNIDKKRIYEILMTHPLRELNVNSLATNSYMSARKLYNCCVEIFKVTPSQLVLYIKLNRAYQLLYTHSEDKTFITKVMLDCGITNITRFNQSYYKLFNEYPKQTLLRKSKKFY